MRLRRVSPAPALPLSLAPALPLSLALSLLALGCGGAEKRPPPLCAGAAAPEPGRADEERTLAADEWLKLLIPSYDRSGEVLFPVKDCTGAEVPAGAARCTRGAGDEAQPIVPLGPRQLVVAPMRGPWRIVWAQTQRHADGEVSGPVALARFEAGRVLVEATGSLRTGPERVSLLLGRLSGATLIVAEGDGCSPPGGDGRCRRTLALVPLVDGGRRLAPTPLVAADGACVGPATVPLRVEGPVPGKPGARFTARASVSYEPNAIAIEEELTVSGDDTPGGLGGSLGRQVGTRKITLDGARLVTSGPALVDEWLTRTEKR